MGNIALNKPVTANKSIMPYVAAKAVNGLSTPSNRWLTDLLPATLIVDPQAKYLVNRWVVKHPSTITTPAGWNNSNYANSDYKLQGSNDSVNWSDIDIVANNSLASTDRTFNPVACRYFRVYVSNGLRCNTKTTSILEVELYQAYSAVLTALTISAGTLAPAFTPATLSYTATVNPDVASINVTPTVLSPGAVIKVNNVTVVSGNATPVVLNYGNNTITVNVTDGAVVQNYVITVTRPGSADLKSFVAQDNLGATVPLNPVFDKGTILYTAKTDYDASAIAYIPTTEDAQATIKLDGQSTPNGSISAATTIGNGITSALEVTATTGAKKTYSVAVSKNTSAYLISVTMSGGRTQPSWNTPFARKTFNYGVTAYATPLTAIVLKEDAAAIPLVTCNGTTLTPTSSSGNTVSYSVPLNAGSNTLVVKVTSTSGDIKTYTFTITK